MTTTFQLHPLAEGQLVQNETLAERARIARDLHDTVLQGLQHLILRLDAAALMYPPTHSDRQRLDSLVLDAERILEESKNCILGLRHPASGDLINALNSIPLEFNKWRRQEVRISSSGAPRRLREQATDHIRAICREALMNAARHSTGTLAQVAVRYTRQWLQVEIEDNGALRGTRAASGTRPVSWGLVGMIERAAMLDGILEVTHRGGQGLKVTLRIPAAAAYEAVT